MAESATFALKAGVWFRRGRLFIVSPDSLGTECPLSGRSSTYRPVQILEAGSVVTVAFEAATLGSTQGAGGWSWPRSRSPRSCAWRRGRGGAEKELHALCRE